LTDNALVGIAENCKNIVLLDVSHCFNISDIGTFCYILHYLIPPAICIKITFFYCCIILIFISGIAIISQKCKELTSVDISKCQSITDSGVIEIVSSLGPSKLKKLNLLGLTKISNTSLISISG
jgi:hypothetical protein